MPAPKSRYPLARYNHVPEHTEPLRMSQCWMHRSQWPEKVAPETIDRRDGATMQITIELPEDIAERLESTWKDLPRAALESLALEAYRSRALTAAAAPCFRDTDAGRRRNRWCYFTSNWTIMLRVHVRPEANRPPHSQVVLRAADKSRTRDFVFPAHALIAARTLPPQLMYLVAWDWYCRFSLLSMPCAAPLKKFVFMTCDIAGALSRLYAHRSSCAPTKSRRRQASRIIDLGAHQGSRPALEKNPPVGPSAGSSARRTASLAPCSTVW